MNIAIDLDGTFDKDPVLWRGFIKSAEAAGHRCYIVTCRRDTEENREDVLPQFNSLLPRHRIKFTGLSAKRWFMEKLDIRIDVWIDDDPKCVEHGK